MPTLAPSPATAAPAAAPEPLIPPHRGAAARAAEAAARSRVIGRAGRSGGPLLICVGGIHGNEPAGVAALVRVLERLAGDGSGLTGEVVGLIGHRRALIAGVRFLGADLNRMWVADRLERLRAGGSPEGPEEEELAELDRELIGLRAGASGPVFVLDLHTTSAPGPAFAVLDDTLGNRAFALALQVPLVLGLEETLVGPLLHHLVDDGVTCISFESGQHDDPASVDVAEAAVWAALEASGVMAPDGRPEVIAAHRRLEQEAAGLPEVTEVVHRHAIAAGAGFAMAPGFRGFERVRSGQPLGRDRSGTVGSPRTGRLLMPLYQAQGDDGFFLVRDVRPFWLRLSAAMRRRGLERWLHLLPGVRRHPERAGAFVVDRRVARWYALEVFHLLGYRRLSATGRELVVSRRSD